MNPRIRELMIEVGYAAPELAGRAQQLVELVVQECLSDLKDRIALRYQGSDRDCDIGYGMEIVYWEIVDKFGVEV
jgi:hypothetical protein